MHPPIITTKITQPPLRTHWVVRDHLMDKLEKRDHQKLILISAPAGYGKSTTVSAWAKVTNSKVAWFTIEKDDNDRIVFLIYLITAIQNIMPGFGQTILSALKDSEQIHIEQILIALINELAKIVEPITLILDDYHLIETQEIHDALIYLVDHLPTSIAIIISSRVEPPFSLHRWRAKGELTEIRAPDLRFNMNETQEFFDRVMGIALKSPEVEILGTRTEGWVTGLQMAALAIQGLSTGGKFDLETVANFINTFSSTHRYILDYLHDEVINSQPRQVQQFLLETSILEHLTAPLCNFILQIDNSQEILAHLENQNLFLIPLDGDRQWFRYHHLFAELLQTNLQKNFPNKLSDLHLRASKWHAREGNSSQAILHVLDSGQTNEVIALAETLFLNILKKGDTSQTRHWLPKLPVEIIRTRPLLCLAQSIVSTYTHHFDYDRAENWALQAMKTDPELLHQEINQPGLPYKTVQQLVTAYAARLQANLIRLRNGSPNEIILAAEKAISVTPEGDYQSLSALWMSISRANLSLGEATAAEKAIRHAIDWSELSGRATTIVGALWTQAYIAYWQGNQQKACSIYQYAYDKYIQPAEQEGIFLPASSVIFTFWASILREMNQLDEAKKLYLRSQKMAKYGDLSDTALDNEIGIAWIKAYQGDMDGIRVLETRVPDLPLKKQEMVLNHTANMKILLGDRHPEMATAVYHWADEKTDQLNPREQLESTYLIWVRTLLQRKRQGKTIPDLASVIEPLKIQRKLATSRKFLRSQIQILVIQALIFQELGVKDAAIQSISEALALAQPEGYARIFINEREPLIPLLKAASEQEIIRDYTTDLLHALRTELPASKTGVGVENHQLIEPLTPRELDVLELVAEGLSNREIANHLVLAPGTVKKYLSSVFQKLNANRRTQAVARAKELGVLAGK